MFVPDDMPDHEEALRIVRDVLYTTHKWPVVSHVRRELHTLHGIRLETLEPALEEQLLVDFAHRDDSRVRLTVAGLWAIDPRSPQLRYFISALRQCYEIFYQTNPDPSTATEVVVPASELLEYVPKQERAGAQVVVGLLFEVEQIGKLRPTPDDERSPFQIVLDSSLLPYGHVVRVRDYLEVRRRLDGKP